MDSSPQDAKTRFFFPLRLPTGALCNKTMIFVQDSTQENTLQDWMSLTQIRNKKIKPPTRLASKQLDNYQKSISSELNFLGNVFFFFFVGTSKSLILSQTSN